MKSIEVNHITKQYGQKTVLKDITFSIDQGEFFGLLGENGAGKTTLIKILTGLLSKYQGDAIIEGYTLSKDLNEIKKITNISPQETAIGLNLTVKENLEFISDIYELTKEEKKSRIQNIVSDLKLEEVLDVKTKKLSGGYQRRLSIALALLSQPKVIYLDEPTLGLDVLARRELWKILSSLKHKITIVLTTHYLEEIEALCDKVMILHKGNLIAQGTVEELKQMANKTSFEDTFVSLITEMEEKK